MDWDHVLKHAFPSGGDGGGGGGGGGRGGGGGGGDGDGRVSGICCGVEAEWEGKNYFVRQWAMSYIQWNCDGPMAISREVIMRG